MSRLWSGPVDGDGGWIEVGIAHADLASNSPMAPFTEERLDLSAMANRTVTGTVKFKDRTEHHRFIQVVFGVEPSFKYGERFWH